LDSFDLPTETQTNPYRHFTAEEKSDYYKNTLSKVKFDFESNEDPSHKELKSLCAESYGRFERKRVDLGISSPTEIYIALGSDRYAKFAFDKDSLEFVSHIDENKPFISFTVDPKLLSLLLRGPRYAHWNNAEIGCHVTFHRQPDLYERGIHYCMNYFHQ
jgi:UDP-MurNAc hydroxylase